MSNKDIILHPTKGVNAHVTACPQCGKDVGIALMGKDDKKFTCSSCSTVSYGSTKCLACGGRDGDTEVMADTERVPDSSFCDECRKEMEEHVAVVREGGVFWRCTSCGRKGVIKPSPFATMVREKAKIAAPELCGVSFNNKNCPACGPKVVDDPEPTDGSDPVSH